MEFRKDPVTQNWVIQEDGEFSWAEGPCPLCPGQESLNPLTLYEHANGAGWEVRVTPHPRPVYRIEGEAERRGEGLYDKMRNVGAHEVVVEHPDHSLTLSRQSDEHVAQVIRACVARMTDLKKDRRFRYVSVFRNQGPLAGQDLEHPHTQITALPFIPRSVVYELRSAQRYFSLKERCLFCDIAQQELAQKLRTVDWNDRWIAFCPFASRGPYETWIIPLAHSATFEESVTAWETQLHLGKFLAGILRRVETVTANYHLVLHTSPNLNAKFERAGHWRSIREDFHWHFEILPVFPQRAKSYSIREVLYNSVRPETAAERLRYATA